MEGAEVGRREVSEQAIAARVSTARVSRAESVRGALIVDGKPGQEAKDHMETSRICDATRVRAFISQ